MTENTNSTILPKITVDLSSYNNESYNPTGKLYSTLWYFVSLVFFQNGWFPFYSLKRFLLRLFSAKIGRGVIIKPFVKIKYPKLLQIGDYSWIGEQVWIDNLAVVEIAAHCCISQGALLLCGNHDYKKSTFDLSVSPIKIKMGSWLGARTTVTGGIVVEKYTVLLTGSTLHNSTQPYGIYRGLPAVWVRKRAIYS